MKRICFFMFLGLVCLGCEKNGGNDSQDSTSGFTPRKNSSLFILNEGSFNDGNASLYHYDLATSELKKNVFSEMNGQGLGDVAQSMTIYGETGWIVVNNSNCILKVDIDGFRLSGRIDGLQSPRYVHFVSETKAYVSQMGGGDIMIINPETCTVTGSIETGKPSTEMFVQDGKYVYVNAWSYGSSILKIDTDTDEVVASLEIGEQPNSMVLDKNGKMWVITDGGWTADWSAKLETPALHRVDMTTFTEDLELEFGEWDNVSDLTVDKEGKNLYFLNGDVFGMPVDALSLPDDPVIKSDGKAFYSLSVSPYDDDIYVSDAGDYASDGKVYVYSSAGSLKNSIEAGVCPGSFCWY